MQMDSTYLNPMISNYALLEQVEPNINTSSGI